MSTTVNVHEAKTHLSRLLARVEAGEEVIIARDGEPVALLICYPRSKKQRELGYFKGQFAVPDDDFFFAPLSEEELREWGL